MPDLPAAAAHQRPGALFPLLRAGVIPHYPFKEQGFCMTAQKTDDALCADFPQIRDVPYIGVAWTVFEAGKLGYGAGADDWVNFGQGQPENGDLPGAPARVAVAASQPGDYEYSPIGGLYETRAAVADWVNRTYRRGKMPYGPENVSFAAGGRLALTRLFGIFQDDAVIGWRNPDYTTYEDYLYSLRGRASLAELRTHAEEGFELTPKMFEAFLRDARPDAFVLSNPCNPTGRVIQGAALADMIGLARRYKCLMAFDEFYSTYVYNPDGTPAERPVSALAHVGDVNKDPVVVFDGLTKNFRYPGWRAGWTVGPKDIIEIMNRAGSAIDGGPSTLVQRAAIEVLQPGRAERDFLATREAFALKRRRMLTGLAEAGIKTAHAPEGTFYIWADLSALPEPLNDADAFFRAALGEKVITVPGHFFDIRPNRVRPLDEPMKHFARLSYGPAMPMIEEGLARLARLIERAKR